MKEQGKNPPDQTNEEEIGSLPEKEFRVMIVKTIPNLGNRMEKIQETFNKDLEELKSKQTMMNNKGVKKKRSWGEREDQKVGGNSEGCSHLEAKGRKCLQKKGAMTSIKCSGQIGEALGRVAAIGDCDKSSGRAKVQGSEEEAWLKRVQERPGEKQ